ncbi:MAG: heavy metal translocating P-type ATPase [Phycisphaerales bacterium]|nr:heavy metal translocating P-type ATPase [Phycisphaerales bacterium]
MTQESSKTFLIGPGRHVISVVVSGSLLLSGFIVGQFGFEVVAEILYALAMLAAAADVAVGTIRKLMTGVLDVDLLMLLAAIGATLMGRVGEAAVLLFLFALGHALEHLAMRRATRAIEALGAFAPAVARRIHDGDVEEEVAVTELSPGDVVRVRSTERIPIDGVVRRGETGIDQSPITGESIPLRVQPGVDVFAGTLNLDAVIDIEATSAAGETLMARMVRMVEEARQRQAPTERTAERFTRIYVPMVLLAVALLIVLPPTFQWMGWSESAARAMTVLVGASPCALAISTPAAVLAGIARTARGGVLVKGGGALEELGVVKTIAFDKTGTLTQGRPTMRNVVLAGGFTRELVLGFAAAVERESTHPLARAVVAASENIDRVDASSSKVVPGFGMEGLVDGRRVLVGGRGLLEQASIEIPESLTQAADAASAEGRTVAFMAIDLEVAAMFEFVDAARPEAAAVIQRLRDLGIRPMVMLSGDRREPAERIADRLGLDEVRAELLPEDKIAAIADLRRDHAHVAMVGDGVNDAPALAEATVGIAMGGCGTDVALEAADVALMADDLSRLPFAVQAARRTRAIILQNVFASMGMVVLLIVLGSLGITNLATAVVLHEGSTVLVVLNALRLLRLPDEPVLDVASERDGSV